MFPTPVAEAATLPVPVVPEPIVAEAWPRAVDTFEPMWLDVMVGLKLTWPLFPPTEAAELPVPTGSELIAAAVWPGAKDAIEPAWLDAMVVFKLVWLETAGEFEMTWLVADIVSSSLP